MRFTKKKFPIQESDGYPAGFVPWAIAAQAYKVYAVRHGDQSLEQLAQRGGFGWLELAALLDGKDPYKLRGDEAKAVNAYD